jgi:hypothetical protein
MTFGRSKYGTSLLALPLILPLTLSLALAGCASSSTRGDGRQVLERSIGSEQAPAWAASTKISWDEGSFVYFKGVQNVMGNHRVSGCYTMARLEAKARLRSEIESNIKADISQITEGLDETLSPLLNEMVSETLRGEIRGLRIQEQYFERYRVADTERVECQVLTSMKSSEFEKLRRGIARSLLDQSAELRAAVTKKQVKFLTEDSDRTPAKERTAASAE